MGQLSVAEGDLYHTVARLAQRSPFVEALAQAVTGLSVRHDGRSTSIRMRPRVRGAVVRAWTRSGWTETSVSGLDPIALRAGEGAVERTLVRRPTRSPPPGASSTARIEKFTTAARPIQALSTEELESRARDIHSWTQGVPELRGALVGLAWDEEERLYLNSDGGRCYTGVCRVRGILRPMAFENGRVEHDRLVHGGVGGQEVLDRITQGEVHRSVATAVAMLKAKAPPAGKMTVLLTPSVTGYLAHESFGHGAEADQFVRGRSYLNPMLGKVVGPEILTIVDNGAYDGAWSQIYADDEGHPPQRTLLVDRGRFVGALHDRASAAALGASPTGNTRRSDFLSRSYVRMTNTYIEPGASTVDELVREAKNGVILESGFSGIEDPAGGLMQVKARRGHLIENGRMTELVSSMALSGRVLEFLASVRGVSGPTDFVLDAGACGKGQTDFLPNSAGGPYLLAEAVVGRA